MTGGMHEQHHAWRECLALKFHKVIIKYRPISPKAYARKYKMSHQAQNTPQENSISFENKNLLENKDQKYADNFRTYVG